VQGLCVVKRLESSLLWGFEDIKLEIHKTWLPRKLYVQVVMKLSDSQRNRPRATDSECVGEVPQQLYVPLKCSKTLQRLLCERSSAYI
jgi:hypothetical protein